MARGRKPIRNADLKIGERFKATETESQFARQYRYHYEKRTGAKFHVEREDGNVYFKRVA